MAGDRLTALTYTVAQTATVLNLSEETVRIMVRRGDLPSMRIGRKSLIARVALEEWVSENRAATFDGWPSRKGES